MSHLGLGMRMLARCGSSWQTVGPRLTTSLGRPSSVASCCSMRQVSTTTAKKAQATKKAVKEAADAAPTKEKKTRTKAKAKAKTKTTPAAIDSTPVTEEKKKTSTTRGIAAAVAKDEGKKSKVVKAKTSTVAGEGERVAAVDSPTKTSVKAAAASSTPEITPAKDAAPASTTTTEAQIASRIAAVLDANPHATLAKGTPRRTVRATIPDSPNPASQGPGAPPVSERERQSSISTSSPEYKQAKRRWISMMVALPCLLVTSYLLYDRCKLTEDLATCLDLLCANSDLIDIDFLGDRIARADKSPERFESAQTPVDLEKGRA